MKIQFYLLCKSSHSGYFLRPMESNEFIVYTVTEFASADLDLLTELAFSAGAAGTEEHLPFQQTGLEYEPVTLDDEFTQVKIYFTEEPHLNLSAEISKRWPQANVFRAVDLDKDWLAEWKKNFKPFALCKDIWVVPSWLEAPSEAQGVIRIDPGMAFGTGTHETTQLAAGFIADYADQCSKESLLDVGTGTAILAILGEKLGFQKVTANDIDPEARRVARENLVLNQTDRVTIVDESVEYLFEPSSFVVANIIDGVLCKIQGPLTALVQNSGYLVLTGILAERENLFRHEFSFSNFRLIERRQKGEWVGYILERTNAPYLG